MLETCKTVIQSSVTLSGLPLSFGLAWHGSDAEYVLGWSGRRTEGIPENFFAQAYVRVKKFATGVYYIEVGACGYDLSTGDRFFTSTYWGETVTPDKLENERKTLIGKIKAALIEAWNGLPQLYQKVLQKKTEQKR